MRGVAAVVTAGFGGVLLYGGMLANNGFPTCLLAGVLLGAAFALAGAR
ncbi:MAG: hypothetical protein AMXMBFR33_35740 [Candidatus Xenobia bacterium]